MYLNFVSFIIVFFFFFFSFDLLFLHTDLFYDTHNIR